ncbi:MAG: hypothetical protein RL122_284 [Pseudomonadota bacterium]|jgi:hypothetical protein
MLSGVCVAIGGGNLTYFGSGVIAVGGIGVESLLVFAPLIPPDQGMLETP